MPFRERSRYPPLRKDTQRDSGAFEWVSCGEHQSRLLKRILIASDCTKTVQILWTTSAAAFIAQKSSKRRKGNRTGLRPGRNARACSLGVSLPTARAIAERMGGRMNPEDERTLDRTALESVLSLRRSKEKKEKALPKERKENSYPFLKVNTYSIRNIPRLRVHTLSIESIPESE